MMTEAVKHYIKEKCSSRIENRKISYSNLIKELMFKTILQKLISYYPDMSATQKQKQGHYWPCLYFLIVKKWRSVEVNQNNNLEIKKGLAAWNAANPLFVGAWGENRTRTAPSAEGF